MHDQIVIHLSPVNPLLLQPGDFYLQVAPFCDQSARILVCSILEEDGTSLEVVEETPIPETSYPCIFTREWLEEINQGRHGTPLSQCLLATEQGLVRLPWERVAVPEFVDVPQFVGSSMASAPPSHPPLPPPLPLHPSFPQFPENPLSNDPFCLSPSTESAPKQYPVTVQNSILTPSSSSSTFSVETRICPAKHGIAVSLRLVDTTAASSSRAVKVKETETESKPIGWVSPNMWDSRFSGTDANTATKTNTVISECVPASGGTESSVTVSENIGQDKHKHSAAEGEYIDILQASMLFGRAQSVTEEQQRLEVQIQPHTQMQRYPQRQAQTPPHAQMEPYRQTQRQQNTEIPPPGQPQAHVQIPTKHVSTHEPGPPSALHHSQSYHPHHDSTKTFECVRTVRFSEKPCTPCMRRRQVRNVSRAQDMRCRYRESYQAALQNPVTFGQETKRSGMLALVEEDGDFSQCDERQRPPGTETSDSCCNIEGMWCDPGMQEQYPPSVSVAICKESGEKNTVPYWKAGDLNTTTCKEHGGIRALKYSVLPKQTTERTTVPFREPEDAHSAQPYLHRVNGMHSEAGTRLSHNSTDSKQTDLISARHCGLPLSSSEISGMNMPLKPHERLQNRSSSTKQSLAAPLSRRESLSDRRCSSLSTAVVDTSEKCELVIVEGQNVRRRENTGSCAEIPQLHVVKCKNSTAFGLVSPKINRRRKVIPGTELCCFATCSTLI